MRESVIAEAVHPLLGRLADRMPAPWGGELAGLLATGGCAEEVRLRLGAPIALRLGGGWTYGRAPVTAGMMEDLLDQFCEGALYAHRETICRGYVTLRDGCRVGIAGRASVEERKIVGISDVSSFCIRLPGEMPPGAELAAESLLPLLEADGGCRSLLICAPPGAGKTTLLRALALRLSRGPTPRQTAVVDSRGELTPFLCRSGGTIDLLTGYPRREGIEIALRTLAPEVILCDEIGDREDAEAILSAQACGVPIIATAHGADPDALARRPAMRTLFDADVFFACASIDRRPGETACGLSVKKF